MRSHLRKDLLRATGRTQASRNELRRLGIAIAAEISALRSNRVPGVEDPVLTRLLGDRAARIVRKVSWVTLVINPGSTSTKVAVYNGLELVTEDVLELRPGVTDGVRSRVDQILDWLEKRELRIGEVSGIAARGGILPPLEAGTYRIQPEMVRDLEGAPFRHASNLSVPIALQIAERASPDVTLTTTDPGTVDEVELVHRMTGSPAVGDEPVMAHYLNQRAAAVLTADALGVEPRELNLITCHMGGGVSAIRHRHGRMVQVSPPFGAMPSAERAGALPLHRVIQLLKSHDYTLDELEQDVITGGGGLSGLAGTTSFVALERLANDDAKTRQGDKARLLLEFFAHRLASGIQGIAACPEPIDAIALTGELVRGARFCRRVAELIQIPAPVVEIPGSLEQSALVAGLLRSLVDPQSRLSYRRSRDTLAERHETDRLALSVPLIETQPAVFDCTRPPNRLDDILEAASGDDPPTIALMGADNADALQAVKAAVENPGAPLARFLLLGQYGPISRLAWELDVPIDGDVSIIVDTDDPVSRATELLDAGLAVTVMKGSCMTADMLAGYLRHLKAADRIPPNLRLSHIAFFEIPGRGRLFAMTDAAMNAYPDVETRISILANALRVMHTLGYSRPKVAVISATEKPTRRVASSVEGLAIAERYAERSDLLIEGPLSVDLALSPHSAREKKHAGLIRGDADLLLVPEIDTGNAIYKALTVATGATVAGIIVGGKRPLILTSRGDSSRTKLASIALACLLIRRHGEGE